MSETSMILLGQCRDVNCVRKVDLMVDVNFESKVTWSVNFTNKNILSSWHLFIISINFNKLSANKDKFIKFMNKKGIFPQYHYIPIYRFKVYNLQQKNSFSNSKYYFKNNISLPIYFKLSFKNVEYIVMNIKKFINLWKK